MYVCVWEGARLPCSMCHRRASLLARCAKFWKMTKTVYWIKLPTRWWHGQLPPVVGVANGHINTLCLCVCVSSSWLTASKVKQNDKFPAASLLFTSLISSLLSSVSFSALNQYLILFPSVCCFACEYEYSWFFD